MTVTELIAELLKLDPTTTVYVSRGKFNSHLAVIDVGTFERIGPNRPAVEIITADN